MKFSTAQLQKFRDISDLAEQLFDQMTYNMYKDIIDKINSLDSDTEVELTHDERLLANDLIAQVNIFQFWNM